MVTVSDLAGARYIAKGIVTAYIYTTVEDYDPDPVLKELESNAAEFGANGVIDIKLYFTPADPGTGCFQVTATGTAVMLPHA
jgi:uncharacterized protein YbjQ (UPF0145 family)